MQQQNNSEIARLVAQIEAEHEAAQRGMVGIAEGIARHRFINAHMERMGALKDELSKQVGEGEALMVICHVMLESEGRSEIR